MAERIAEPLVPGPGGTGVAFVTGAAGFLGGAAASALADAGWIVVGFGHPARGPAPALARLSAWLEGDIDAAVLGKAAAQFGTPELLFHAAGGASVGASIADPETDRRRTLGSLDQALAFMRDGAPAARLLYPSSAAVYGAEHPGPIAEQDRLDPISPYGRHKLQAEQRIQAAAAEAGLDAVIVRFFSLYGPGLRKQLPWELTGRLLQEPTEVGLSGTGEEVRDFLYVTDAVRLLGLAATLPRQAAPRIINGGGGRGLTVRRLAETLRRVLGATTLIDFNGAVRPGDPSSLLADPAQAEQLGFSARIELTDGLQALAAWVRSEAGAAAPHGLGERAARPY